MFLLVSYLTVGLIFISIVTHSTIQEMVKKDEGNEELVVLAALIAICILTVLWPALLTMKIANKFQRKNNSR
ncbi:hypothetical protein P4278_31100 [Bacillus thuringiensis]|nr:hypothetical protein [Bacillus thuringiensis]MED2758731.1 hypothetical protein [Bacillus thuringiensis]MED2775554.1 hypothetical protein [Bacillus thuringiensis]MED2784056.1 hypothetical protein [Bacillus thuringiensis]